MSLLEGIKEITSGDIKIQEPMKNHTSLRIGGPADFLVIPNNIREARDLLLFCRKEFIPLFVFGGGTNLLVSDKGIRGIALKLEKPFRTIDINGSEVTVGAGFPLPLLANYVGQEGLSGLEFAAGIPGTVGGAAGINAGAYGNCMAEIITGVKVLTWEGEMRVIPADEISFSYRYTSLLEENWIILETRFRLVPGDHDKIKRRTEELLSLRRRNHPIEPSAGSVFKNPLGESAGRLIEMAGCKGLRVGDAQVSLKHANFIVNLGNAQFVDYVKVITAVRKKVFAKCGIWLDPEINLVGEES